jgi:hypothetical protein
LPTPPRVLFVPYDFLGTISTTRVVFTTIFGVITISIRWVCRPMMSSSDRVLVGRAQVGLVGKRRQPRSRGTHGVSVTTPESNLKLSRDPEDAVTATRQQIEEAGFGLVHTPTYKDDFHHTGRQRGHDRGYAGAADPTSVPVARTHGFGLEPDQFFARRPGRGYTTVSPRYGVRPPGRTAKRVSHGRSAEGT